MKFSIIVPVYNVEKYIDKCLKSIKDQTYSNYEVIIVNDGSPDNSCEIIDKYCKKDSRFIHYKKKNGGLSDARNYGVKKASGNYLVFVDSDDYISKDLLEKIDLVITKDDNPDLVRYQVTKEDEKTGKRVSFTGNQFTNLSGYDAFRLLTKETFFETTWTYAYKLDFWKKNKFSFEKGKYHEDFGLTPYVILKAERVSSITDNCYNYLIRKNSITTSTDLEKRRKRVFDVLDLYDLLKEKISKDKEISVEAKSYSFSYLANALLQKGKELDGVSLNEYVLELKKRNITKDLQTLSMKHKIKKFIVSNFMLFYIKCLTK